MNSNATKHISEETNNLSGSTRNIAEQVRLADLSKAIDKATANGIPTFEKMVVQDGWELIFSAPRSPGLNPVLKHARHLGVDPCC